MAKTKKNGVLGAESVDGAHLLGLSPAGTGGLDSSYLKHAAAPGQVNTQVLPVQQVDRNGVAVMGSGEYFTLFPVTRLTTGVTLTNIGGTPLYYGGRWKRIVLIHNFPVAGGGAAGDTLDAYVDISLDGVAWYNAVHFTQAAGNVAIRTEYAVLDTTSPGTSVITATADAAAAAVRPALFGAYIRARYTLTFVTAPIITFSIVGFGI